ncbi:MAG: hypothetical protein RR945_06980 [Erysipelotrichaceae bacterium]
MEKYLTDYTFIQLLNYINDEKVVLNNIKHISMFLLNIGIENIIVGRLTISLNIFPIPLILKREFEYEGIWYFVFNTQYLKYHITDYYIHCSRLINLDFDDKHFSKNNHSYKFNKFYFNKLVFINDEYFKKNIALDHKRIANEKFYRHLYLKYCKRMYELNLVITPFRCDNIALNNVRRRIK